MESRREEKGELLPKNMPLYKVKNVVDTVKLLGKGKVNRGWKWKKIGSKDRAGQTDGRKEGREGGKQRTKTAVEKGKGKGVSINGRSLSLPLYTERVKGEKGEKEKKKREKGKKNGEKMI